MIDLNNIFLSKQTEGQGLLGHQLLISMMDPGRSLNYYTVCDCLEQTGFEDFKPKPPNTKDAWRRATGTIPGNRQLTDAEWCRLNLIRVNESNDPIERVVQATLVDKEGREVSEGKNIARLLFYSENQSFEVQDLYYFFENVDQTSRVEDYAYERINRARELFHEEVNSISIESIRLILRRILMSMGNAYKRIESAWFVPTPKKEKMDRFVTLLDLLSEHARTLTGVNDAFYCVTTPVYNSVEQRTQIRKDFIHHAIQVLSQAREAASLPLSANEERQGRQIDRRLAKLDKEIEALQKHADMYRAILKDGLKEIDDAVQKAREEVRERFQAMRNEVYVPSSDGATRKLRTEQKPVSSEQIGHSHTPTRNIRRESRPADSGLGGLFEMAGGAI